MKQHIFDRKLNEKYGYDEANNPRPKWKRTTTKRERTEKQHKKKRCTCGVHSIKGHKERSKYPRWKKNRKR